MVAALRIILSDAHVRAVLINIFGGITRCDEVARGIVTALRQVGDDVPVTIRLVGTNDEAGRRILNEAGYASAATLEEGARRAIALAQGGVA